MAFPPDDNWFRKIRDVQRRLDMLLNPFRTTIMQHQKLLGSIKLPAIEYQKLLGSIKLPAMKYQRGILAQASIRGYLSMAGFSDDYLAMQQKIQNSLGSISSISKELELLRKSTRFNSILAAQKNLYRLQDQFSQARDLFELPFARIESVLAAAEATSRIFQPYDFFVDFTLSSVAEYQFFLDKQYKLLQYDNGIIADRRIQVAELSGGLFEIINVSLDIGVALESKSKYQGEEIARDEIPKCWLYGQINQHLGYVYSKRYSGEIETSFYKSIPAQISFLGYSITEQIYKINSICENNRQDQVFKPTSRTMRACAIIPSLIARNEMEFYLLIDHLFFLLYEGSGAANRLTPIIDGSLLEPLWKVKHLRLAARHDIDHGSSKEIEKKRAKIKDAYFSLIAKPLPIKQNDWQKAQLQIYVEIDLMLQNIIQEIMNKS